MSVDEIVDLYNLLQNIDEAHCSRLVRSSRNFGLDHAHGMVTVCFSAAANSEVAPYASAVQEIAKK